MRSMRFALLWCVLCSDSTFGPATAQRAAAPPAVELSDAQRLAAAARIQGELTAIRGLRFKETVRIARGVPPDIRARLDASVSAMLAPEAPAVRGRVVRKLGLHRGPLIDDEAALLSTVLQTQVAAFYMPVVNTFFVVTDPPSAILREALYSHELHHGLQHQNFDLLAYQSVADRNQDALLARRAVVEGEACYVASWWLLQRLTGRPVSREGLAAIVAAQSEMTSESLRTALRQSTAAVPSERVQATVEAMEQTPEYLLRTHTGASLMGQAFVFAVQAGGWTEVDALYGERAPLSTEQILHPEKWSAQEGFMDSSWPQFTDEPALRGWTLLQQDVLGEFQWRIVFNEYGFAQDAQYAAAGWNGDRYAIFQRADSAAMLLLWRTSWDTVADAMEFAALYRRLLAVKYLDAAEAVSVVQRAAEVAIVEGGSKREHAALLEVMDRAVRRQVARIRAEN